MLLGEGKWGSPVGTGQGADHSKDQLQLRAEFCAQYGAALYPGVERFVVLLATPRAGALTDAQRARGAGRVLVTEATWDERGGLAANPWRTEFLAQLAWRAARSRLG